MPIACEACATTCGAVPMQTHTTDGMEFVLLGTLMAGQKIGQHAHSYDHATLISTGSVRLHCPGEPDRDYPAPFVLTIRANVKHQFTALVDNTVLLCIHNTFRTGQIERAESATPKDLQ